MPANWLQYNKTLEQQFEIERMKQALPKLSEADLREVCGKLIEYNFMQCTILRQATHHIAALEADAMR